MALFFFDIDDADIRTGDKVGVEFLFNQATGTLKTSRTGL
jgi:hypothetical protein